MANTAQTVEREAPAGRRGKVAKAVEVQTLSKDCLGLQNPFGHVAACADLRRYLFLHTHDWYCTGIQKVQLY